MLTLHVFTFNGFAENTYIWSHRSGECFIIDPGCSNHHEEKEIVDFIITNQLRPKAVLLTHAHIDHVLGLDFIVKKFGLEAFMHQLELPVFNSCERVALMYGLSYSPASTPLYFEENKVQLGDEQIDMLYVPGHSPGHVAFYHSASDTLVCGDTLFRESIGRTDLPGGDYDTLIRSIKEVLFTLPEQTKIYPGHMDASTIGFEKSHNPFF